MLRLVLQFLRDNVLKSIIFFTIKHKIDFAFLDENRVIYQITDQNYMLPDMSGINTAMIEQMNEIRNNNYILPSIEDKSNIVTVQKKEVICPISFDPSLIKR